MRGPAARFVNGAGPIVVSGCRVAGHAAPLSQAFVASSAEYPALSILRVITLGGIIGLSTAVVCFVAADRVAHTAFPVPPAMTIASLPLPEPETTGTLTQEPAASDTKPARAVSGFDTERLNALMRGEMPPPPPPVPVKTAARKR